MTRRSNVLRVVLAAAIALLDAVDYLLLMSGYESEGPRSRTTFVVAFLVAISGLALVGAGMAASDQRSAGPLLWAATTGYVGLGLVGIASSGVALLIAAGLTSWSALRWSATPITLVAATVPIAIVPLRRASWQICAVCRSSRGFAIDLTRIGPGDGNGQSGGRSATTPAYV